MFADKYLNDMEAAADVAQECFIRLWRGDMTFETEDKVRGFLYTMARNLAWARKLAFPRKKCTHAGRWACGKFAPISISCGAKARCADKKGG